MSTKKAHLGEKKWWRRAWAWLCRNKWKVLTLGLGSAVAWLLLRGRPPAVGVPSRSSSTNAQRILEQRRTLADTARERARIRNSQRKEADRETMATARSAPDGVESLADRLTSGRAKGVGAKRSAGDGSDTGPRGRPVP